MGLGPPIKSMFHPRQDGKLFIYSSCLLFYTPHHRPISFPANVEWKFSAGKFIFRRFIIPSDYIHGAFFILSSPQSVPYSIAMHTIANMLTQVTSLLSRGIEIISAELFSSLRQNMYVESKNASDFQAPNVSDYMSIYAQMFYGATIASSGAPLLAIYSYYSSSIDDWMDSVRELT